MQLSTRSIRFHMKSLLVALCLREATPRSPPISSSSSSLLGLVLALALVLIIALVLILALVLVLDLGFFRFFKFIV